MSLIQRLRDALLLRKAAPAVATVAPNPPARQVEQLPPFSLPTADLMRFDPQVRIGLGARNGLALSARIEATGGDERMVRWVRAQWDRVWALAGPQLLRAKLYGFVPFELTFRAAPQGEFAGLIEPATLRDLHPRLVRLLVRDGQPAGFALRAAAGQERRVPSPRALVCTFDAEFGNPYGCSLLERAYPAWYEKWMEGGAKKTLRLRMIKDSYVGDILWYPPDRKVQLPGGETVSWRDIARDLVEARLTGGALTLPLVYDHQGRKLIDYTPPQDVGRATQLFRWKRDVDHEIWKALEVPPEIIEAASTGSGYSGRWIPFVVALSAVQQEVAEIVRCVDRDLLRPLAQLNFGREPQYELRPQSLVEQYAERMWRGGSVSRGRGA